MGRRGGDRFLAIPVMTWIDKVFKIANAAHRAKRPAS
jgi:hypothetical protein